MATDRIFEWEAPTYGLSFPVTPEMLVLDAREPRELALKGTITIYRWVGGRAPRGLLNRTNSPIGWGAESEDITSRCRTLILGAGAAFLYDAEPGHPRNRFIQDGDRGRPAGGWQEGLYTLVLDVDAHASARSAWKRLVGDWCGAKDGHFIPTSLNTWPAERKEIHR